MPALRNLAWAQRVLWVPAGRLSSASSIRLRNEIEMRRGAALCLPAQRLGMALGLFACLFYLSLARRRGFVRAGFDRKP